MDLEHALEVANSVVFAKVGRRLNEVEAAILLGALQEQTYEQIAYVSGYSLSYIKRNVGPKLWSLLEQVVLQKLLRTGNSLERELVRKLLQRFQLQI